MLLTENGARSTQRMPPISSRKCFQKKWEKQRKGGEIRGEGKGNRKCLNGVAGYSTASRDHKGNFCAEGTYCECSEAFFRSLILVAIICR